MSGARSVGMFALGVLAGVTHAGIASASHGGPDLAEVLGWDARDQKVYVLIHHQDESESAPTLLYFALRSTHPERPVVVPESPGLSSDDGARRLAALRQRLQPLPREVAPSMSLGSRTTEVDAVVGYYGTYRRFDVWLYVYPAADQPVVVETIVDSIVTFPAIHTIPGHKAAIVILAFRGMPIEHGYEVQEPVLLTPGRSDTVRVKWSNYGGSK